MSDLDTYLQRKAAVLTDQRETLTTQKQTDPDAGRAQLSVSSHVAGITGLRPVKMGDYTVVTDSAPALAGHSLGPSSPQMLLGALASCLAHTYVLQAALHGLSLQHVGIEVSGILDMNDAINPQNSKNLAIENISYRADIRSEESAEELVQLDLNVEQACAVLNTIRSAHTVQRL